MEKLKSWIKLLGSICIAILAFLLAKDVVDMVKDKQNKNGLDAIKKLEKRKVKKDAFKNNNVNDNLSIIRRIIKRRRDK